jgi:hypothetical protein
MQILDEPLVGRHEDLVGRAFPDLAGEIPGRPHREPNVHARLIPEGGSNFLDGELQIGGGGDYGSMGLRLRL